MKKILVMVVIGFTLVLTGCKKEVVCEPYEDKVEDTCIDNRGEFEKAIWNMQEITNYKTTSTAYDVPWLGNVVTITKVDGSKIETILWDVSTFYFEENNKTYVLSLNENDEWVKLESGSEYETETGATSNLKDEDFDLVDGVYVAKKTIQNMMNLEIEITNGYVTKMSFDIFIEGNVMRMVNEYSDFGNVVVTLPDYE